MNRRGDEKIQKDEFFVLWFLDAAAADVTIHVLLVQESLKIPPQTLFDPSRTLLILGVQPRNCSASRPGSLGSLTEIGSTRICRSAKFIGVTTKAKSDRQDS
jgi:hypothetical protein